MATKRKVALIILDGWGIGNKDESNPIYIVKPKIFDWLEQNYPLTSLQASGIAIGLPWGETGNSEVGHLTLGAGKIIYQYYPRITMSIQDGTFFQNKVFLDAIEHCKTNNSAINFIGLLSNGNVHSSIEHLLALIKLAKENGLEKINCHLFADGKDCAPHSFDKLINQIPKEYLASVIGRYYGMDREGNWQLTQMAYQTMIGKLGRITEDPILIAQQTYKKGNSEEYLPAMRFSDDKKINNGDSIIFFNYREDSIRQIASVFIKNDFDKFAIEKLNDIYIATMTHYDDNFDVPVAYPQEKVTDPLGKVLSDNGLSQMRIAESYKYAHVTYFFNGFKEDPYPGEYRALIPSLPSLHNEEHPEMMAVSITDRLNEAMQSQGFDFILVNYANPDTMGHTANFNAAVEAVKVIDREISKVIKVAQESNTTLLITSDHGNIEEMINEATGLPESQHDPNPVPLYIMADDFKGKKFFNQNNLLLESGGTLADVAPTILEIMSIKKPKDMTGISLLDQIF